MTIDPEEFQKLLGILKNTITLTTYFRQILPLTGELTKVVEDTKKILTERQKEPTFTGEESVLLQNCDQILAKLSDFLKANPMKEG